MTTNIEALRSVIAADWSQFDIRNQLTSAVSDAITSAAIMRELVPAEYGGLDGTILQWFRDGRDIAQLDGSCGWVAAQGAFQNTMVASQADPAFARLFFSDPQANIAGAVRTTVRVQRVGEDKYELNGAWQFESGARGATYLGGLVIPDGDALEPRPGLPAVLIHRDQVEIQGDWNPIGLRGTGSHSVRVTNVVVPGSQFAWFFSAQSARIEHRFVALGSSSALISMTAAAVQLGIARRALELAAEILSKKSQLPLLDAPLIQEATIIRDLGTAEGNWVLANAGMEAVAARLDAALGKDDATLRQAKIDCRLAAITAVRVAADVTRSAYDLCGTDSQTAGSPIERCFRDAHVLTAHVAARPRGLAGLERLKLGIETPLDLFAF